MWGSARCNIGTTGSDIRVRNVTFVSQNASAPDASSTWRRTIARKTVAKSTRFPMNTTAPISFDPASASSNRHELSASWSPRVIVNGVNCSTTPAVGQRFAHLPEKRNVHALLCNMIVFIQSACGSNACSNSSQAVDWVLILQVQYSRVLDFLIFCKGAYCVAGLSIRPEVLRELQHPRVFSPSMVHQR